MKHAFFPPGDSTCTRRSHWREFVEARDAVFAVLGRPSLPSELLAAGPTLGPLLACPQQQRLIWSEEAQPLFEILG